MQNKASNRSTWLVTGASGLLGSNAVLQLKQNHRVLGAARNIPAEAPVAFESVNLADASSRAGLVKRTSPQIVLHAAAVSSIEECESDPALAHEVNVVASADLATQAKASGAAFIYISTDAVFDGASGGYAEDDEPSPTTEYGRSKLAGERAVLNANPDALVARVNFYGWSPTGQRSLAEFFYRKLNRGETVQGFDDVVVSTLYVGYLVELIERLAERDVHGIVNVVSRESTSKYEFGRRLARSFGFAQELVHAAHSSDHLAVKRGSLLGLNTERIETILGTRLPSQQSSMDRLVADFRAGRPQAVASFRTP